MATDERKDRPSQGGNEPLDDVSVRQDEGDLTPPHGDDLRSEETFGRTDRYSNMDDADADRTETLDRVDDREAGNALRNGHASDSEDEFDM